MLGITDWFFLLFFVQFVDPAYPQPELTFLALSVILQIVSFVYLGMLIFVGLRLTRGFKRYQKISALGMG